jgi:fructose-1,6-bisphosphatase/inositol monophosphatase family enzyme
MPSFHRLTPDQISCKSDPQDLVTVVDELAEKFLSTELQKIIPGSVIVGEESVYRNPALLEHLVTAEYAWLVDPLDGTKNFVRQVNEFGVIVALIHRGQPQAGWIYLPVMDELLTANHEEGALRNGHKIPQPMDKVRSLPEMRGLCRERDAKINERLQKITPDHLRTKCSAYDFNLMASGLREFIVYGGSNPWDVVAGSVILELMGGRAGKANTPMGMPLVGKSLLRKEEIYLATRRADDWPVMFDAIFH